MRIAYFVPFYPSFLQTYILNEMLEILRCGHDVVVVPLYPIPSSERHQQTWHQMPAVRIWPAPLFDFKVACLFLASLVTHPLRVLGTLVSLHWAAGLNLYAHVGVIAVTPKALATAWRLRGAKVDRIHAHFATHTAACAAIAGRVSRIPFSFTAHAHDIYCRTAKLRNQTLAWKLRQADHAFAVSHYAAGVLRQIAPTASHRIHTAYVGIPTDLFREQKPLARRHGDILQLLCVCHFGEKKGLRTLIDACALLRNQHHSFHLRLYGGGLLHQMLAARIAAAGLRDHVTLGGLIPQEEVARQMAVCHAFVMPCRQDSAGNMDGIPTVFIEAMATGRPVISCPISGIPELVRDGETGLLVPPNDAGALADAVQRLANDDELRIRLGRQARALVEEQHDQRRNARLLMEALTGAGVTAATDAPRSARARTEGTGSVV